MFKDDRQSPSMRSGGKGPLSNLLHATVSEALPEFVRLPRSGEREKFSGLSRSACNALVLGVRPPVKSVVLKKRGASRGVRLIELRSLISHLRSLMPNDAFLETESKKEAGAS
jgi:hypothetical protein